MSNLSNYTCVSSSVVERLKLKRIDALTSKQFRDILTMKKLKNQTVTCLEEFTLSLGGIDIPLLRNAVEVRGSDLAGVGVQLGQDFFLSAAWCIVDVQTAENTDTTGRKQPVHVRTDGGIHGFRWNASLKVSVIMHGMGNL